MGIEFDKIFSTIFFTFLTQTSKNPRISIHGESTNVLAAVSRADVKEKRGGFTDDPEVCPKDPSRGTGCDVKVQGVCLETCPGNSK